MNGTAQFTAGGRGAVLKAGFDECAEVAGGFAEDAGAFAEDVGATGADGAGATLAGAVSTGVTMGAGLDGAALSVAEMEETVGAAGPPEEEMKLFATIAATPSNNAAPTPSAKTGARPAPARAGAAAPALALEGPSVVGAVPNDGALTALATRGDASVSELGGGEGAKTAAAPPRASRTARCIARASGQRCRDSKASALSTMVATARRHIGQHPRERRRGLRHRRGHEKLHGRCVVHEAAGEERVTSSRRRPRGRCARRRDSSRPDACSGGMNAGVPIEAPVLRRPVRALRLAQPRDAEVEDLELALAW